MNIDKDKIILIGDIHGQFPTLSWELRQKQVENAYLIQVGDFGMGFYKPGYYKTALGLLNSNLVQKNNHLYAIRGNHDDPDYFKSTNNPFELSNITLLADYSELTLLDKSILCVGGAISVDRVDRVLGKSYWEGETFRINDQFPYKDRQYDAVITHTRPTCAGGSKSYDKIASWLSKDELLKANLIDEANKVQMLYELTKPTKWFYGHFHESFLNQYENTEFRCLNIDELYEYRS